MSDQQIENIVDGIVDIVLTDVHVMAEYDHDEDGHHVWFETAIADKQRAKLVDVLERLLT